MKTTYRVLKALNESSAGAISGEKLAQELGLSRNSIWKAIESLRQEGHLVPAQANRGYVLETLSPRLNEDGLRLALDESFERAEIKIYQKSKSTNLIAKEIMDSGLYKCLVVSKEQVFGKGRNGKAFFSPKGGLYFSFAYRPKDSLASNSLLTIAIGLATIKSFKDLYDKDLSIKWVNDLKYNGKKVAGILTEASLSLENMAIDYIICGIGLNISQDEEYPEELKDIAGPIFQEKDSDYNPNYLIASIIKNFFELKDRPDLVEMYKKHCDSLGKFVEIKENKTLYKGKAIDIDNQGRLVVETKDGQLVHLTGNY